MASSFWTVRTPDWNLVKARAKQLLAGAAESTIANASETPGNYRPAAVDAIPATAGVIAQLIKGKQFDNSNAVEQVISNSMRRAQLASDRTNKTLGINNPQNTDELALRIAGGLIVPQPGKASVAKALSKVPGGTKAVRAAEAVSRVTPKPVRKAAKIAAEVVTPLRQTKAGTAGAVGAAMTGLLDPILEGSVDPVSGERYESSFFGDKPKDDSVTLDIEEAEIETLMRTTAEELGDAPTEEEELDNLMSEPLSDLDELAQDEDEKLSRFEQAALAVGAVLGGSIVAKYSSDFLAARSVASLNPDLPQFTGKAYRSSRGGVVSRVKGKFVQQDEPIRNMAEEFLGRQYAKQWGYRADRMTNVSIGARAKHFFQTGITPSVEARSVKLAPLAEAYAKELTPDEQRLVSDALNAASALDDYRATGVLSALNRDKQGNPVNARQLEMLVDEVRNNPKYEKYFSAVQQSYDDLLKYRVARGRDSNEAYTRLRARRPNYVAMNRNLEGDAPFETETHRYSANTDQGLGAARSLEEGGGVQGPTGVGNPFVALFDEWTNEIRRSDLNELRADFLINMDASGALNNRGKRLIEQVTPNRTDDDIHRVRVNGRELAFKVRDPEVARSLHMSPRASVKILEGIRQAQQSMTTGPLATVFNMFAVAASPMYDALLAGIARPKGVKLGLANRAFVGGYTGAIRYMWDDMRGAMATTLRDNMIREHSWLKGLIGEKNLDNLAGVFENAYENSIKADMDRLGITSTTMHGSPDPSRLASGVEQVAPHFAQQSEAWMRDDIANAVRNGDLAPFKALLATGKSAYATANANRIARVYQNLVEALHNGVRYSALAANKGRIQNLDKLTSDLRRLSADSSQHGGNDAWNKVASSFMYANLGVQSLYEVGRRAIEQPGTFLLNVGTVVGSLAAMHYAALGSDPDALEKHRLKTPQQRAMSLTTFGGAELKLDPVTRLFTSALFPIYDHMSGALTGDYNPNFFKVMESWLEGETPELNEATSEEAKIGLWEAIQANNPLAPSALPVANVALAAAGVDPGMSRITDETVMGRTQQLTGMDATSRRPDSMVSAHTENMIAALFSTAGRSILQMTDDLYRAHGKTGDLNKSTDVALSRWRDTAAKSSGLFRPILFGNQPSVESASDINYQLLRDRQPGIEQALAVMNKDVRGDAEVTSLDPRTRGAIPVEEGVAPPPEIVGTELEYIAGAAQQLQNMYLSKHELVLGTLGKQIEGYNAQYITPIEQRNVNINKLNEERRYQRMMMLARVKEYEELISNRIGRPFTFKDFDPADYSNPLAPSQ